MPSSGPRWSFYLCGAKKIIHAAAVTAKLHQNDTAIVMDWIYYHEVMSEFSIRHWLEADAVDNFCKGPLAHRPEDMPVAYQVSFSLESKYTTCSSYSRLPVLHAPLTSST